jgi:hypothetical protein
MCSCGGSADLQQVCYLSASALQEQQQASIDLLITCGLLWPQHLATSSEALARPRSNQWQGSNT